jgi:hypothetical protein
MTIDERLFWIADEIAQKHTKRRWFESLSSATVRKIRLRTAIYNAMASEAARLTAA